MCDPLLALAPDLCQRPDGIYVTAARREVSFPESGNRQCFAVEENSFWFAHRNRCILALLKRFPSSQSSLFLDIGGGNGFVSMALQRAGYEVVLIEPGNEGAQNAKARGVKRIVWGAWQDLQQRQNSIESAGLFDVLEHVEDDLGFLKSVHATQRPGGRLYLTVPSLSALWSHEDVDAGHFRRYSAESLSHVLTQAGYRVDYAGYLFGFLVPVIFFLRSLPYRFGLGKRQVTDDSVRSDHVTKAARVHGLLEFFMRRELNALSRAKRIAVGSSWIAVATKAGD